MSACVCQRVRWCDQVIKGRRLIKKLVNKKPVFTFDLTASSTLHSHKWDEMKCEVTVETEVAERWICIYVNPTYKSGLGFLCCSECHEANRCHLCAKKNVCGRKLNSSRHGENMQTAPRKAPFLIRSQTYVLLAVKLLLNPLEKSILVLYHC